MAYEATQSLDLERNKGYITQNKDILTKKIRWDNYLKAASYFMYSLFISLLSLSFLFSGAQSPKLEFQYIDFINIFIGLFVGLFSMGLISWVYKGSLKKLFIVNYYIVQLVNALLLSLIIIIMSIPLFAYPADGTIDEIVKVSQIRSLVFGIGLISWFVFMGSILLFTTYKIKGAFPTSWLKVKLSLFTMIIFPTLAMVSWGISIMPQMSTVLLITQLIIFVLGFLYTSFSFTYVRTFKELILSNKTEQEIQKIDFFRNISFLMILMPALSLVILGITKALPILSVWSGNQIEILSIVSMSIDAVILITYVAIIIWFKKMGKKGKTNMLISSIDNSILMDFISWFILIKTIIIAGLAKGVDISAYMSLSTCFIAIFVINISTILIGVNFPNIKNTTSTIVNVVAYLAILGMVLFQSTFPQESAANIFEGVEMIILTLLPALIASSINLGIKLLSYSKISYEDKNNKNEKLKNTQEIEVSEKNKKQGVKTQDKIGA